MASITFSKWDLGIDLRKGPSVSDANRLREMKNAYVTTGLAAAKRPGLRKVAELEPGTKGLFSGLGKLHTFCTGSAVTHADPLFQANLLESSKVLADIPFADVFSGKIYCAAAYDDGTTQHHYLDQAATAVTDVNCPHTRACLKTASKIFAVGTDGDVVRYCKTGAPRDWTLADDAGFLPTGLNARGDRVANALGLYQSNLVVLSRDGAQVWKADPDPAAMALLDMVDNVGTSHPRTVANVGGDLYFLSDFGFRSITTLQYTANLADVDVGSPIDALVRPVVRQPDVQPKSFYYYGTGQYICAIGNHLFVYSVSRTSKIAAWSQYFLRDPVDAWAEHGQSLYIRCGDVVYALDDEVHTDDGQQFEVLLDMAYMDFKRPGVQKHIYGVDVVVDGKCQFAIGYDVRDPDAYTDFVTVKGNTRPGGMVSAECVGTEFALRFRNYDNKPFRVDAVTIYYDEMGG